MTLVSRLESVRTALAAILVALAVGSGLLPEVVWPSYTSQDALVVVTDGAEIPSSGVERHWYGTRGAHPYWPDAVPVVEASHLDGRDPTAIAATVVLTPPGYEAEGQVAAATTAALERGRAWFRPAPWVLAPFATLLAVALVRSRWRYRLLGLVAVLAVAGASSQALIAFTPTLVFALGLGWAISDTFRMFGLLVWADRRLAPRADPHPTPAPAPVSTH